MFTNGTKVLIPIALMFRPLKPENSPIAEALNDAKLKEIKRELYGGGAWQRRAARFWEQ